MRTYLVAIAVTAATFTAISGAQARRHHGHHARHAEAHCRRGQIYRVSIGKCEAKVAAKPSRRPAEPSSKPRVAVVEEPPPQAPAVTPALPKCQSDTATPRPIAPVVGIPWTWAAQTRIGHHPEWWEWTWKFEPNGS